MLAVASFGCSICDDDQLIARCLARQFWQHRRISNISAGVFNIWNFQHLFLDPHAGVAPVPSLRVTMHVSVSLVFDLDPLSCHPRSASVPRAAKRDVHCDRRIVEVKGAEIQHIAVQVPVIDHFTIDFRAARSAARRFQQSLSSWRSAIPSSTFTIRRV